MSTPFVLVPRSAFTGLRLKNDAALVIERDDMGLATVQARKVGLPALRNAVAEKFGLHLPMGATRAAAAGIAFAGTAPDTWLASKKGGGNAFASSLMRALGDCASVADQSDALAMLQLSGPRVRDLLARLVPVDLHSRAFKAGDVASTVSSFIGVTAWRLEDDGEGMPVFELALPRSFAASFAHVLTEVAAGLAAR